MTRTQWKYLPEAEREAIRQYSAEQSLRGYTLRQPHPRSDWDKAIDVWAARDAYRVQNFFLGLALLLGLGFLVAICSLLKM